MTTTPQNFFTITYQVTTEFACESIAAAGGRGTQAEIAAHIAATKFRQRVAACNTTNHIAAMAQQGYTVVDVALSARPIA